MLMFVMLTHCILCVPNYRQLGDGVCGATYIWPNFIFQLLKLLCATHLHLDSWSRSHSSATQVCRWSGVFVNKNNNYLWKMICLFALLHLLKEPIQLCKPYCNLSSIIFNFCPLLFLGLWSKPSVCSVLGSRARPHCHKIDRGRCL
jgi:hypothetical protein